MRRVSLALPLVLLLVVAAPRRANVWETWCADDPLIVVNGNLVDVQVQMPLDDTLAMRSTTLTAEIP